MLTADFEALALGTIIGAIEVTDLTRGAWAHASSKHAVETRITSRLGCIVAVGTLPPTNTADALGVVFVAAPDALAALCAGWREVIAGCAKRRWRDTDRASLFAVEETADQSCATTLAACTTAGSRCARRDTVAEVTGVRVTCAGGARLTRIKMKVDVDIAYAPMRYGGVAQPKAWVEVPPQMAGQSGVAWWVRVPKAYGACRTSAMAVTSQRGRAIGKAHLSYFTFLIASRTQPARCREGYLQSL